MWWIPSHKSHPISLETCTTVVHEPFFFFPLFVGNQIVEPKIILGKENIYQCFVIFRSNNTIPIPSVWTN
jgi:hypothetical protein